MSNPAVTRIPDAHFFWEARYNGTKVIAISPEFTPTAMHSSHWVNPRPGTDTALAMAMVDVILEEKLYDARLHQRADRPAVPGARSTPRNSCARNDLAHRRQAGGARERLLPVGRGDQGDRSGRRAPGLADTPVGRDRRRFETLELGAIRPALEGRWTVRTLDGEVEVTTVFELLKQRAAAAPPGGDGRRSPA